MRSACAIHYLNNSSGRFVRIAGSERSARLRAYRLLQVRQQESWSEKPFRFLCYHRAFMPNFRKMERAKSVSQDGEKLFLRIMKPPSFLLLILCATPLFAQQHASTAARDYYAQLYEAGVITENAPPSPHVCFPDSNKEWPDMFFIFKAYSLESNEVQEHIREMKKEPYVTYISPDLAKLLLSPEAQKLLLQGERFMSVQTYTKGVSVSTSMYYWDKDIKRWETQDRFPTGKNVTSTMQLLIEPKTLRYVRFMHATPIGDKTDGSKGSGTFTLEADSGVCEGPIEDKQ
jgi:hypothetical protein